MADLAHGLVRRACHAHAPFLRIAQWRGSYVTYGVREPAIR